MTVPVAMLAVLAVVGGWIQVAGVWHPFGEWLDPIAFGREHLALVEPTVTQDYVTSALAVGLGAVGIGVAWMLYGSRKWAGAAGPGRPADARAQALVRRALRPRLLQARRPRLRPPPPRRRGAADRRLDRRASRSAPARRPARVGEAQTGYLRSYALAIAAAVAVLVVVFITVQ